ncbi:hypothetical protein ACJDU8_07000 [Clostridium sp. WILCCON 0269]|uniref:Uncharacterized protein n=1 Tax=Candidatus Clostridium eludens TaxID=3381663 RepID=A0ABW8SHQ5_9CLOT
MEDIKFLVDSDRQVMKETILIELGRLENEEDIKITARYIYDTIRNRKLTAHQ